MIPLETYFYESYNESCHNFRATQELSINGKKLYMLVEITDRALNILK